MAASDFQVVGKNSNAPFTLKLHRGDGMCLVATQLPSPSTGSRTCRAGTPATEPLLSTCVQPTHSVHRLPNYLGDDLRRWLNAIDQAAGLACV